MKDDITQLTTEDEIKRRRVCEALTVLGGVALAGCSGDEQSEETDPQTAEPTATPDDEDSLTVTSDEDGVSELSPVELITDHNSAIAGQSYTIDIELQDEASDPDVVKELTYKRSAGGDATVSLEEIATIDDGVSDLTQVFTPDEQYTVVTLDSGETLTSTMDTRELTDYISIEITGSSVFLEFLAGATIAPIDETEPGDEAPYPGEYELRDHRQLSSVSGSLRIRDTGVIDTFSLEWVDDEQHTRWMDVELSNIGDTDVRLPSV